MAKKQEKEIEKWVTVNGARVPIFKDGSIGGPKALRDKVKATQDKKTSTRKRGIYADDKHADDYSKAIESLKSGKVTKVPLGKVDNATISKAKQAVYKAGDKAGKQYGVQVSSITEKTKDGNYQVTGKALSVIELKQTGSKSSIKDDSAKEKQISRSKKEADERNVTQTKDANKAAKAKAFKQAYKDYQDHKSGKKPIPSSFDDMTSQEREQWRKNTKQATNKEQRTKAITELQMYGKKKDGRPYSKKDAEEAVKSMTPAQIKKLADKRDERRAYQEKLTASSDMSLKKQYKTASFEEQKEIQAEMHSRGYFYRDGKWIDRFKARGYRQWGRGNDWD